MESRIRIKATMPEMYTFFKEETGVRFMEIHHMQAAERSKIVFEWRVILRHPGEKTALRGTFTIPGITKKLGKLKAECKVF